MCEELISFLVSTFRCIIHDDSAKAQYRIGEDVDTSHGDSVCFLFSGQE